MANYSRKRSVDGPPSLEQFLEQGGRFAAREDLRADADGLVEVAAPYPRVETKPAGSCGCGCSQSGSSSGGGCGGTGRARTAADAAKARARVARAYGLGSDYAVTRPPYPRVAGAASAHVNNTVSAAWLRQAIEGGFTDFQPPVSTLKSSEGGGGGGSSTPAELGAAAFAAACEAGLIPGCGDGGGGKVGKGIRKDLRNACKEGNQFACAILWDRTGSYTEEQARAVVEDYRAGKAREAEKEAREAARREEEARGELERILRDLGLIPGEPDPVPRERPEPEPEPPEPPPPPPPLPPPYVPPTDRPDAIEVIDWCRVCYGIMAGHCSVLCEFKHPECALLGECTAYTKCAAECTLDLYKKHCKPRGCR